MRFCPVTLLLLVSALLPGMAGAEEHRLAEIDGGSRVAWRVGDVPGQPSLPWREDVPGTTEEPRIAVMIDGSYVTTPDYYTFEVFGGTQLLRPARGMDESDADRYSFTAELLDAGGGSRGVVWSFPDGSDGTLSDSASVLHRGHYDAGASASGGSKEMIDPGTRSRVWSANAVEWQRNPMRWGTCYYYGDGGETTDLPLCFVGGWHKATRESSGGGVRLLGGSRPGHMFRIPRTGEDQRVRITYRAWARGSMTGQDAVVDVTVAAHELYRATFDPNGGSAPSTPYVSRRSGEALGANPQTSRDGYSFLGWYDSVSGGDRIDTTAQEMPPHDVTYYAHWELSEGGISYDLSGGTVRGHNPNSAGRGAVTLMNPVRDGYEFTGWSGTGLDGSANMRVTIPPDAEMPRRYVAHWRAAAFTVEFDPNPSCMGGVWGTPVSGSMSAYERVMRYGGTAWESYVIPQCRFIRYDERGQTYDFVGWAESPDERVRLIEPGERLADVASGKTSIRLYAIWMPRTMVRMELTCGKADGGVSVTPGDNGWYNLTGAEYAVNCSSGTSAVISVDRWNSPDGVHASGGVQRANGFVMVPSTAGLTYSVSQVRTPRKSVTPAGLGDYDVNTASGYEEDGSTESYATVGFSGEDAVAYTASFSHVATPTLGRVRVLRRSSDPGKTRGNPAYSLRGVGYLLSDASGTRLGTLRANVPAGDDDSDGWYSEYVDHLRYGDYTAVESGGSRGYAHSPNSASGGCGIDPSHPDGTIEFAVVPQLMDLTLERVSRRPYLTASCDNVDGAYDISGARYVIRGNGLRYTGVTEDAEPGRRDVEEMREDAEGAAWQLSDPTSVIDDYTPGLVPQRATVTWRGLPMGDYSIDRTSGSPGYGFDGGSIDVSLDADGASASDGGGGVAAYVSGSGTVVVRDYATPRLAGSPELSISVFGMPPRGANCSKYYSLSGARFAMYRDRECERLLTVIQGETDASGLLHMAGRVPYGTWWIRQVTPCRNYSQSDHVWKAEIRESSSASHTFGVIPLRGRLYAEMASADPYTTRTNANYDLNGGVVGVYGSEASARFASGTAKSHEAAMMSAASDKRRGMSPTLAYVGMPDGEAGDAVGALVGSEPGIAEAVGDGLECTLTSITGADVDESRELPMRYSDTAALWQTRSADGADASWWTSTKQSASDDPAISSRSVPGMPASRELPVGDWWMSPIHAPEGYMFRDEEPVARHVTASIDMTRATGQVVFESMGRSYAMSKSGGNAYVAVVLERVGGSVYEMPVAVSRDAASAELTVSRGGAETRSGTMAFRHNGRTWYASAAPTGFAIPLAAAKRTADLSGAGTIGIDGVADGHVEAASEIVSSAEGTGLAIGGGTDGTVCFEMHPRPFPAYIRYHMARGSKLTMADVLAERYDDGLLGMLPSVQRALAGNSFHRTSNLSDGEAAVHVIPLEWPVVEDGKICSMWSDRPYLIGVVNTNRQNADIYSAFLIRDLPTVWVTRTVRQPGADGTVWRRYVPMWMSLRTAPDRTPATAYQVHTGSDIRDTTSFTIDLATAIDAIKRKNGGIYPNLRTSEDGTARHECDADWYPTNDDGTENGDLVIDVYISYEEINATGYVSG